MWLVLCKKGLSVRLRFALFEDLSIMIGKPLKSVVNSKHLFPWCLENPYDFPSRNVSPVFNRNHPLWSLVGNLFHGVDICGQNGDRSMHLPSYIHTIWVKGIFVVALSSYSDLLAQRAFPLHLEVWTQCPHPTSCCCALLLPMLILR